jgi:hypothetical protein
MLPAFSGNDSLNSPLACLISARNCVLRAFTTVVKAPHLDHVWLGEPGVRVLAPPRPAGHNRLSVSVPMRLTVFRHHVFGVSLIRSEEQVIRSDAASIVTAMADDQMRWSRTMGQFPRQPMRRVVSPLRPETPIAVLGYVGRPDPTAARLVDLGPEPLWRFALPMIAETACRAEAAHPLLEIAVTGKEWFRASFTERGKSSCRYNVIITPYRVL